QHVNHGQRERGTLGEDADRVADVVAEILQRRELGATMIGAVGFPVVGGDGEVRADLFLQVVVEAAPLQPRHDGHAYSLLPGAVAGFITRLIAVTSSLQRDSSRRSCCLPAGVSV